MCIFAAATAAFPTIWGTSSVMNTLAAGGILDSAISSIGGFGLQALGQFNQASVAQEVAKNNAKIAEYQAKDAEKRGEQEALEVRRRAAQFKGGQRAKMAANGLDLTYGTQADILDQTDFFSQMDEQTVRSNARKEAWNRRAQKSQYQAEASSGSPWMAAGGTLLSGAGQVASRWYDMTR